MYTLLKNIKELFDLFGCVTLYQFSVRGVTCRVAARV
jgi:hypothetical protein